MRTAIVAALCLYLLSIAPAPADEVAATTCAASLDHEALLVFDTIQAVRQPAEPLRKLLAVKVGGLVTSGKLSIFSARSAATAASECLRIARNCTAEVC
jgi:hypothetical protein